MIKAKHILLAGGGLLLLVSGVAIVQAAKAAKTGDGLVFTPEIGWPKVTGKGIEVELKVRAQNPTQGTLRIRHPFLSARRGSLVLGSSRIVDREYALAPFSEITIPDLVIDIPMQQAAVLLGQVTGLLTNQITALPLFVSLSTYVKAPGVPRLPVREELQIILKNPLLSYGQNR